jgi:hypothetical protein
MRSAIIGIGICALLTGCGERGREPPPVAAAAPANPQVVRAVTQLEARLGEPPVLSDLRHGTNDGKAVLCGEAATRAEPPTPFVMRGGYLVLPVDGSPEQFATLRSFCTGEGPGPAS